VDQVVPDVDETGAEKRTLRLGDTAVEDEAERDVVPLREVQPLVREEEVDVPLVLGVLRLVLRVCPITNTVEEIIRTTTDRIEIVLLITSPLALASETYSLSY
jgi:hypothetical protein